MTTHFNSLLPKQQAVRGRGIFAANRDINDFFGLLLDAAAPAKRQFPNAAPRRSVCRVDTPSLHPAARANCAGELQLAGSD